MSGTSLDGVDAVLADFSGQPPRIRASAHQPFPTELRAELLALQSPGYDEIARAAAAGNALALAYAAAVDAVVRDSGSKRSVVQAIGCHGQTVRHRPERGFTSQIGNAALLAERTSIRVVASIVPIAMWGTHFAILRGTSVMDWPVDLWAGTLALCSLFGLGAAVVAFPPRMPAAQTDASPTELIRRAVS